MTASEHRRRPSRLSLVTNRHPVFFNTQHPQLSVVSKLRQRGCFFDMLINAGTARNLTLEAMRDLKEILISHQRAFAPVVPFDAARDKLLALDFTAANLELTADILENTNRFTTYINQHLHMAQARYGIGGYMEHRTVYSRSRAFDAEKEGEEPRRLHLGVDIWGRPHTPVISPMDAIVHSFGNNDRFGDYGATILLSHQLERAVFHTLYGHLSLNSIKNLREGDRVEKGDTIGEFGIPSENGHWPPHLHFQVIFDLQGWKGDYPGVARFSEMESWKINCPDPDLILQMNKYKLGH